MGGLKVPSLSAVVGIYYFHDAYMTFIPPIVCMVVTAQLYMPQIRKTKG